MKYFQSIGVIIKSDLEKLNGLLNQEEISEENFKIICKLFFNIIDVSEKELADSFEMSRPTSQRYKEGKIVPHPAVQRLIIKYFKTKLKSIKARDFAIIAHGNQKYGDQPYVVHLDEVFNVLLRYGKTSDNLVNICYLHDVLEDTDVTYEQIEKDFGDYISTCVHAITDPSGKNRKEKKAKLYEKLKRLDYSYNDALIIKAADRLANIRMAKKNNNGFLSMYKKEHNDLIRSYI